MGCDLPVVGEWSPDIAQGGTFNIPIQIAVLGVIGYNAGDTFEGWITDEPGGNILATYTFDKSDPGNGIVRVKLTPAETLALPIGALYHSIEWHRSVESDVIPLFQGRPDIQWRSKNP